MSDNPTAPPIDDMPEDQMKQLVADVLEGLVFGSWNFQSFDDYQEFYAVVFLPLMGELPVPENAGVAYEYMSEATAQRVENYPVFMSVKFLSKTSSERLRELLMAAESSVSSQTH